MIDYKPNLAEDKRKATIDLKSSNEGNTGPKIEVVNKLFDNSVSSSMKRISYIESCNNTNYSLDDLEEKLFGDIFSYEVQDSRINSIVNELGSISDTLSIMVYGEVIEIEEAEKRDKLVSEKIKKNGQANNNNLYYLSKIFNVVNKYIDDLEKQVDSIKYINYDVNTFTSNDERELLLDESEVNSIHLDLKTSLSEQLLSTNFVSDNLIIKNYLCKFYNHLIDYNKAVQAIDKIEVTNLLPLLEDKEEKIESSLKELMKLMEYSKVQGDSFLNLLFSRLDLVKSFYK